MPKLVHFTEDQMEEIRGEIKTFLRPYRIRFYAVLLGFLVAISGSAYLYQETQTTDVARACRIEKNLVGLITVAIPRSHVKGRTPAQQRNVDEFYRRLKAADILSTPDCGP